MSGSRADDDGSGAFQIAGQETAAIEPSLPFRGLASYLERTGRHPVIVFGTVMSGKTMLLVSLIYALQRGGSVHVSMGEWVLGDESIEDAYIRQQAGFFGKHVQSFVEGQVAPATLVPMPFFIPIDIQPRGGGRSIRLALMEGMGEWYEPRMKPSGSMLPDLRHELSEVLQNYGRGMSVIWVAPSSIGAGEEEDTRSSDLGLFGAMNQYTRCRTAIAQDFHLFLLTKWDTLESPLSAAPALDVVDSQLVQETIEKLFPKSWTGYQALPLQSHGQRYFMQYSAGRMIDNRIYEPPERLRAAFYRYPQTVLNWICGNASQIDAESEGRRERLILFPDVPPPRASLGSPLKRILRFLGDANFYHGVAWGGLGTAIVFLAIILLDHRN